VFLQTAEPTSILNLALPLLLVFGIYYFIVILPANRSRKKVQEMIDNLKIGDKIVTNSGIYGTIAGLKDDRIQVRVAENVKIEMARSAVTSLQYPESDQSKQS
jgi:preprotein translocase subunit YajC